MVHPIASVKSTQGTAANSHVLPVDVDQLGVQAAHGHQLVVGALFDYLALLQHDDPVRAANGGQPVGYDYGRPAFRQLLDGLRSSPSVGVTADVASSRMRTGVAQERPGYRQSLLLPPESLIPRSPICVSYPLGISHELVCPAATAASMMSSRRHQGCRKRCSLRLCR